MFLHDYNIGFQSRHLAHGSLYMGLWELDEKYKYILCESVFFFIKAYIVSRDTRILEQKGAYELRSSKIIHHSSTLSLAISISLIPKLDF